MKQGNDLNHKFTSMEYFLCGAVSGVANSVVSVPVEHMRIRVQAQITQKGPAEYTGSIDAFKKIWSRHGITGIYKGLNIHF
jgi:solute carrier family 25 carnitine/acylcarnitine transporter 20/29